MTKRTKQARVTKSRTRHARIDIYETVTARILEQLEQGVAPWKSPHFAEVGFPRNYQSGKCYQGCNVLLLGMAGFVSPYFLTYRQAQERGGQVRKGEKGHLVVKCGEYARKTKDEISGEESTEWKRYLKGYRVFNACQIDGIDFPEPSRPGFTPSERAERAKDIVRMMPTPPNIQEGRGVRTCYIPERDTIEIPHRAYFESEERFFESLFHELVHATGHASRLAREGITNPPSKRREKRGENYGKEELVAEIGSAFLMAHAGIVIDDHEQNATYVAGWLKILQIKEHRRWIVEAAAQAEKAVSFILSGNRD